jgi:hypothetical protein
MKLPPTALRYYHELQFRSGAAIRHRDIFIAIVRAGNPSSRPCQGISILLEEPKSMRGGRGPAGQFSTIGLAKTIRRPEFKNDGIHQWPLCDVRNAGINPLSAAILIIGWKQAVTNVTASSPGFSAKIKQL